MDCFSHKDSCRMGINLEYYMSVLKEQEFFHNLIHDFFFIISSTVELLCIELIDLYSHFSKYYLNSKCYYELHILDRKFKELCSFYNTDSLTFNLF